MIPYSDVNILSGISYFVNLMIIVRPVQTSDINEVLELAKQAYPGMTTLPPERDVLEAKIENSVRSINNRLLDENDATYFLVMEDIKSKTIIGTAAIIACLGAKDDFYSYKIDQVAHRCRELDKRNVFQTLSLSNHFQGFAEVATLYLNEDFRKNGNGKFLAQSRYLFMAQFRERFPSDVMADLRGCFDEHGRSPFWDALGSKFFDMDYAEADLYSGTNGNQFISDLMPKYPIYVNMLPHAAQQVIGKPNVAGEAALKMLEAEGFAWHGYIDIFDAAPSVDTKIDDIDSIRTSQTSRLLGSIEDIDKKNLDNALSQTALVASNDLENFMVTSTELVIDNERHGVWLPTEVIDCMSKNTNDQLRYLLR